MTRKGQVGRWIADILAALQHLHDRDPVIMHRDLKPANILLPRTPRAPLRLADFGLAKSFARNGADRNGTVGTLQRAHTSKVGTPRYWAPEVLACLSSSTSTSGFFGASSSAVSEAEAPAAVYNERCDVYSAGLVLWFLLTGHRPTANVMLDPWARPNPAPAYRRWPEAAALAERMWSHDPESRPSAAEALQCVRRMEATGGGGLGCGVGCTVA